MCTGMTTADLTYRPFTREELSALSSRTIVARRFPNDPEPDLFRHRPGATLCWALLTGTPVDFDWEWWSTSQLFDQHAEYAIVYLPEESE